MPATSVEHEADSRPQSKATGAAGAAAPLVSATPLVSGLYTLHLVGNIRDARFHQALACANVLADRFRKNVVVRATTLTPLEWALYVDHVKPVGQTRRRRISATTELTRSHRT